MAAIVWSGPNPRIFAIKYVNVPILDVGCPSIVTNCRNQLLVIAAITSNDACGQRATVQVRHHHWESNGFVASTSSDDESHKDRAYDGFDDCWHTHTSPLGKLNSMNGTEKLPEAVAKMLLAPDSHLQKLLEFTKLQAARTRSYRKWTNVFAKYIQKTSTHDDYVATMAESAEKYAEVRAAINQIAEDLRTDLPELRATILKVGDLENEKVKLTVQCQLKETETILGEKDYGDEVIEIKKRIVDLIEEINEQLVNLHAEMAEIE
ncbi:hypothetical protein BJ742DRAFT_742485 [Cladochytrium replicatum]|nr:hypothetical protein BJ742DRAFT_742485 [Cladochytrium replicatum]